MRSTLVALLVFGSIVPLPANSAPLDCRSLPADALTTLPAPFSQWASLRCLPSGQLLSRADGWVWRYPGSFTTEVVIPASMSDTSAGPGAPVFSRAESSVTEGVEAQALEERFRRTIASYPSASSGAGSSSVEQPPPTIHTLLAVNDVGDFLELHVVYRSDRDIWAVVCAPGCKPENVFMIYRQE